MKAHRLANIFPAMTPAEFAELKEDIAQHGVHTPIVLYRRQILDGRSRYQACEELGQECKRREYEGDDPLGFVVSMNLKRRHLNESQRASVVEKLANMPVGRHWDNSANLQNKPIGEAEAADRRQGKLTESEGSADVPKISQAQAAKLMNVSTRLVAAAAKVRREGQPEVIEAIEAGQLTINAAIQLIKEPVPVQRQVARDAMTGTVTNVKNAIAQAKAGRHGQGHEGGDMSEAKGRKPRGKGRRSAAPPAQTQEPEPPDTSEADRQLVEETLIKALKAMHDRDVWEVLWSVYLGVHRPIAVLQTSWTDELDEALKQIRKHFPKALRDPDQPNLLEEYRKFEQIWAHWSSHWPLEDLEELVECFKNDYVEITEELAKATAESVIRKERHDA